MKNIKYLFLMVITLILLGCSNNSSDSEKENKDNIDYSLHFNVALLMPETENTEGRIGTKMGICPGLYDNIYLILQMQIENDKLPTEYYIEDLNNNLKNIRFEEVDINRFGFVENEDYYKDWKITENENFCYKYYIMKLPEFTPVNSVSEERYKLAFYTKQPDGSRFSESEHDIYIQLFNTEITWRDLIEIRNIFYYSYPYYKTGNHVLYNEYKYNNVDRANNKDNITTIHEANIDDYVFKSGKRE